MKRILWIDDDERLIDDWAPVFSDYGFEVAKATNTSRALTVLRTQHIDGVLLDVRLGRDENGLEFLDDLRHRNATLPVAILTGNPDYGDWKDARVKGAAGYLWKFSKGIPLDPVEQRQFFAALDEAFPGAPTGRGATAVRTSSWKDVPTGVGSGALWLNGLFFVVLVTVLVGLVAITSNVISPWLVPIALISTLILFAMVGLFVLRTQGKEGLSEQSFRTLLVQTLRLLSLIGRRPNGDS